MGLTMNEKQAVTKRLALTYKRTGKMNRPGFSGGYVT